MIWCSTVEFLFSNGKIGNIKPENLTMKWSMIMWNSIRPTVPDLAFEISFCNSLFFFSSWYMWSLLRKQIKLGSKVHLVLMHMFLGNFAELSKQRKDLWLHFLLPQRNIMSTTNRTLLSKALPYSYVILFLRIFSILILTLTSLHHRFLGLAILRYIYIFLFMHTLISNLTYTVTLILLPIGSEKAAGKVSSNHNSKAESWHEQFSGKQPMQVSRSGLAKQAKP